MKSLTRKRFIKQSCLAILNVSVLAPLQKIFALQTENANIPNWIDLCEIAKWCPTVHNLQPHRIKIISQTEAELYYEPNRLLPIGDPNAVFATVALGVFVEHLAIVAKKFGYDILIYKQLETININAKSVTYFTTLKLVQTNIKEYLHTDLILNRRTSRLQYNDKKILENSLQNIQQEVTLFQQELYSTTDDTLINTILKLNENVLLEDITIPNNSMELNHLFRYSKQEAIEKKDGLWAKCMGFSGKLVKAIFKHPKLFSMPMLKNILAKYYATSFQNTSTICWIAGKFENTNDWFSSGRMLARMWLSTTNENAYIQPFGSLITNANAYEKINTILTQSKNINNKIWLLFRIGYSKTPTKSFRLNTKDLIIK